MKNKFIISTIILTVILGTSWSTVNAQYSGFWKFISNNLRPLVDTWDVYAPANLEFYGEIQPDGATCSNGQILKRTAANDWDCAADATGGGGGGGLSSTTPFSVGYIPFATTTNSLTNSNIFQSGSNIGIGTTTPAYKLDVWGDLRVNTSSTLGTVISGIWNGTAIADGYISSAATWNAKQNNISWPIAVASTSLTGGAGLTLTTNDMACDTASGSVFGCLASADWTTFNNKQGTLTFPLAYASTTHLTATSPLLITAGDLSLTGRLSTINGIATTTGNLIVGRTDTTGWYGLLVGANGKVLTASSTATNGISWETVVAGATPGGNTNDIQFNSSGSLAGSDSFTYTSSSQLLTVPSSTITSNLTVNGTTTISASTTADFMLDVFSSSSIRLFAVASSSPPAFSFGTTTASIGGGSLAAGACAATSLIVPYALSTSTDNIWATPQVYPGDSTFWKAWITTSTPTQATVNVAICESVLATPTASAYNLTIIRNLNNR